MKFSSHPRALWSVALATALVLGTVAPANARQDDRAVEREQREDKPRRGEQQHQQVQARQSQLREKLLQQSPTRDQDAARQEPHGDQRWQNAQSDEGSQHRQSEALQQQPERSTDPRRGQGLRQALPQQRGERQQQQRPRQIEDGQRQVQQPTGIQSLERERAEQRDHLQHEQASRQQAGRYAAQPLQQRGEFRQRGLGGNQQPLREYENRRDHPDNTDRSDDARRHHEHRLGGEQQERRIRDELQRAEHFHRERGNHQRLAEQRARALQQQRRMAQYRYQQQYYQRLRLQQARWDSRGYNYYNDPYYSTPASYRYSFGGRYHQTNRYGADLMRQAVNYGYREGLRAGQADRQDRWGNDYRSSYAYEDANYGYNGYYVSQDAYNHYFRQGFQRGYDDGYDDRYRYGQRDRNGEYAILAAVLGSILGLQLLN